MIPVAPGEVFDKKTILEIKRQRVADADKRVHVEYEWQLLDAIARQVLATTSAAAEIEALERELFAVNVRIWDVENDVRAAEKASRFDSDFIEAARQVYLTNDRRAALKNRINALLGSQLIEVKEHR